MNRPAVCMEVSAHLLNVEVGFTGVVRYLNALDKGEELGTWSLVFHQGRLGFAHYSLEPLERLDRHLRRLSHQVFSLTRPNCLRIHRQVEALLAQETGPLPADLLGLSWMVTEQLLPWEAARRLNAWIGEEVLQNLLLVPGGFQQEIIPLDNVPTLGQWDGGSLLDLIQKRLRAWQSLGPEITSPYQRPYFASQAQAERLPAEQQERLGRLLKGFSFRQLSALLDQDDLQIARRLHPLVKAGILVLRDPQPPFDRLPKTYSAKLETELQPSETPTVPLHLANGLADLGPSPQASKTWIVACIDDSEAMLSEIQRLLEGHNLVIHTISDSLKALMKLTTLKPDLILLDVGMPNVDGYQLCSLIRKSSVLKDVPVVMVTGHKGLIDRVKARLVGATDYLTKPFRQEELLQMVFRYLG
ncbi:MAG TPA: response regulator [Synechococcus sp. M44_DOE_062]|nr:response regulator [Synechococcus sp. M44_DOE_062]